MKSDRGNDLLDQRAIGGRVGVLVTRLGEQRMSGNQSGIGKAAAPRYPCLMELESPSSIDPVSTGNLNGLRQFLTRVHLIGAARMVDRGLRRLVFVLVKGLETLSRIPVVGSAAHFLLVKVRHDDALPFDVAELNRVIDALEDGGVHFWLAGGWGIDALVGCQTRRHSDLDVVIDDFSTALTTFHQMLRELGYRHLKDRGGTIWFPNAVVYQDRAGHSIEVLGVNGAVLAAARDLFNGSNADTGRAYDAGASPEVPRALTTIGRLGERSVPTISLPAQRLFHAGYPGRPEDGHANAIFDMLDRRGDPAVRRDESTFSAVRSASTYEPTSLILVPIFDFPHDLWRLCRLYHNDLNLIPPHVTVAFPFLPVRAVTMGVVRRLRELFVSLSPIDFTLEAVKWFGTEVVYLEPSRSDEFKHITEALQEAFPAFRPYDGEFDSIIPHVTLAAHGKSGDHRMVARYAPRYLPITSRATHAWLMTNQREEQSWEVAEMFPIGGF